MRFLAPLAPILLFAATASAGRLVTVDLAPSGGHLNRDLAGTTQGTANPSVATALAAIAPPHIRIDTWFDNPGTYDCTSEAIDFTAIDQRVRNVRAVGAEPLVIIDYMPACLSRYPGPVFPLAGDPTRHPPASYPRWGRLVRKTVEHLAADPDLRVRWFEAWNEPNLPQFFIGTIADYLDLFDSIHDAVASVAGDLALDLRVVGPAIAFPDPTWLSAFLVHVVAKSERLDFVSWHWYASYPLFGPLAGNPPFSVPPANVENPLLKPRDYADHTTYVRALVHAAWAARSDGMPEPKLWIDEWNLNAGRDPRHDTSEAAAFAAATLDFMQRAGLDRSSFFNVEDAADLNFNQGMFFFHRSPPAPPDGTAKPVYTTFRFFHEMADDLLAVSVGPLPNAGAEGIEQFLTQEDNVGAIASRSLSHVTVMVYNWSPRVKRREPIEVAFSAAVTGTVEVLSPAGLTTSPIPAPTSTVSLVLDDASVAFLDLEEQ